jgi:EF-P beta-lysylation protein EpmB
LFPLRVPRGFVARMRPGDPHDPLLRQVLPLGDECLTQEGFGPDPVGDSVAMVAPGVLHKYEGRVLLTATGACAVHCRYCFRRHFSYSEANACADHWRGALTYIAGDTTITEVILSGGDPLTLSDRRLAEFTEKLAAIPHVQRLRMHTRLPIVLPERVNDELIGWLGGTRLKTIVVVHANHANEIDAAVRAAVARLKAAGVALLNQSVLLRGVNDSAEALAELSTSLFDAGVLPYYLHLLDRVQGAGHFEVDETVARDLMTQLNARLPGYLVPRLVREVSGAPAKSPVAYL